MRKSVAAVLFADDLLVVLNSFCVLCYSARKTKKEYDTQDNVYPIISQFKLFFGVSTYRNVTSEMLLEITDGK